MVSHCGFNMYFLDDVEHLLYAYLTFVYLSGNILFQNILCFIWVIFGVMKVFLYSG